MLNLQLRPLVSSLVETQAKTIFTSSANDAIIDIIDDAGADYDDIISLTTDQNGKITSIQTNASVINYIKAGVGDSVLRLMQKYQNSPQAIRLGTLSGIEMFAGRGPEVELRLELRGGITAEITSQLYSTGINQSHHVISCIVSADVYAIIPGYSFAITLQTNVIIAESVIVGEVPEAYTFVVGDESDTIGRIFDYGSEAE